MLTRLSIQGLAVIESLEISFSDGFNVITGETGAGKSILIKALDLLLGGKATAETVRQGCDEAHVCAEFVVDEDHPVFVLLEEMGIPLENEGGELPILVRRRISPKARSQAWVNDVPLTVASLRQIGVKLIDIFGQHENHRLLNPQEHLFYLDAFLPKKTLGNEYRHVYHTLTEGMRAVRKSVESYQAGIRDRDYLQFRLAELDQFEPAVDEYEELKQFCQRATSTQKYQSTWHEVRLLIDEGAGGESLARPLWEAARLLRQLNGDGTVKAVCSQAEELAAAIDDLSYSVGQATREEEVDPQELEEKEDRLAKYQDLCRKMSVDSVEELVKEWERLSQEVASLETAETQIVQQLREINGLAMKSNELAGKLSRARRKAARAVKEAIEAELKDLAMAGARVEVEFTSIHRALPDLSLAGFSIECQTLYANVCERLSELGESGSEKAQFLLASNPGEPAFPLQKIASGGEISRIMLALKRSLAAGADSCLLVFDEIDAGISGKVADMVGRKLKDLAANFQVLCISHLAQVAAYAETHFLVEKQKKKQRTESSITCLSKKDSIAEIARLISGPEITKQSLANAKQLVARAEKNL